MSGPEEEKPAYQPQDSISIAIKSTMILGGGGALIAGVQNTLSKSNVGPWGIFTRSGSTIAVFAAVGGSFSFVKTAAANLREKDDPWNSALGGLAAGSIVGLRGRTMPAVLGYGAALAAIMSAFEYTGGVLTGWSKDPNRDEFEDKESLRKRYRRPIQETLEELGEGRGIYGPGYEQRRKERIKQRYGVEVP